MSDETIPLPASRENQRLIEGRFARLQERARAVIAAGRPHTYANNLHIPGVPCPCPQCAAWDELKKLLEEKP